LYELSYYKLPFSLNQEKNFVLENQGKVEEQDFDEMFLFDSGFSVNKEKVAQIILQFSEKSIEFPEIPSVFRSPILKSTIESLLKINPKERPTANEILSLPYIQNFLLEREKV
jgi:serine/threonine protein kinase